MEETARVHVLPPLMSNAFGHGNPTVSGAVKLSFEMLSL